MRFELRKAASLVGATTLLVAAVAASAPAYADNVQDDIVAGSSYTFSAGGSAAVNYSVESNGSDGCNVDASNPATITVSPPSGLSASPLSVQITSCGAGGAQTITFSSSTPGTYNVEPTASGGLAGNDGYNTAPSKAKFVVTAAADTTPPVITPTVTGTAGSNGWYTSDVTVSWSVTDAQSAVTSTSGCGSTTLTAETAGADVTCTATSAGGTSSVTRSIKIDNTGPSASLSPAGTAGSNGWFVSDVAVTTSGTDTISGPVTCTAVQNLTAETAGQTVNGSCTNNAGLSTNATSLTVKIDKTGPTAVSSAVTSGTPGANGWYTSDVTVATTGTETVSGPTACSGPVTLTSSTTSAGTDVTGGCTNAAGLSASAAPLNVKIDKSKPSAALSAAGTLGSNDWYVSNVTVTTSGADAESGASCSPDQYLTTDTSAAGQDFNGSCTNGAGLTEDATTLNVKRDASAPTATLVVTAGTPGANGWYTSDVTVVTQGADAQSGVTCSGGGSVTAETSGITFNGYCVNGAGTRTDAAPLTIKLDKSGPSAVLAAAGTEGLNGWYTDDVTVSTSGTDSISSPVVCTADQSQTTETAGQVFNGSCTNAAGLSTDAAPLTVKLDTTGPTDVASSVTSGTAGAHGWYTSDVVVSTTGSEDISGPASCTPPATLQGETAGADAAGSCTNQAGLTTDAPSFLVKIDKSAPTASVAASGTAGANGWFTGDVTVTTTGSDTVSEPVVCDAAQTVSTETTGQLVTGSCTNDAGLSASASTTVKLDKTAPVVTVTPSGTPGSNGWYVSAVTLTTSGVESISAPIACTGLQTQPDDTSGATFSGSCTNDAGLTGTGSTTVKVDATKPDISAHADVLATATSSSGAVVTFDLPTASDATSGLAAPLTCDQVSGSTFPVGSTTVTCTVTDSAGNTQTSQFHVVVTFGWHGFFQPIDAAPNNSNGRDSSVIAGTVFNKAKAGSSIPVKFDLSGNMGLGIFAAGYPKTTPVSCSSATVTDTVEETTTSTSGLKYDGTTNLPYGQYIYTWKTATSLANSCQRLEVRLADGTSHYAFFQFTK